MEQCWISKLTINIARHTLFLLIRNKKTSYVWDLSMTELWTYDDGVDSDDVDG